MLHFTCYLLRASKWPLAYEWLWKILCRTIYLALFDLVFSKCIWPQRQPLLPTLFFFFLIQSQLISYWTHVPGNILWSVVLASKDLGLMKIRLIGHPVPSSDDACPSTPTFFSIWYLGKICQYVRKIVSLVLRKNTSKEFSLWDQPHVWILILSHPRYVTLFKSPDCMSPASLKSEVFQRLHDEAT